MSKPSGDSRHSAFFVQPASSSFPPAISEPKAVDPISGLSSPAEPGSVLLATSGLVTACIGLFIAAVLSVGHILDLPIPCGGGQGCDTVAAHPASKVFDVPIAFFGMLAYLTQVFLLGQRTIGCRSRLFFLALASLGTVVSAGLLLYAHWLIQATCLWCVASALMMSVQLGLGLLLIRAKSAPVGPRPLVVWGLAFATALLIGAQAGRMERLASAPPLAAESLAGVTARILDDPLKSLGPSHPAVTLVVFADLLCPACRQVMGSLLNYQQANAERVRLVYRHRPLWKLKGHELSKAAAALSEIAAEEGKFWAFAEAVHGNRPVTRHDYLEIMSRLQLDPSASEARLNNPEDPAIVQVQRDMDLADRLGVTATPTFLVLVGNRPPISASQRSLPRILNSPLVLSALAARNDVALQR